MNVRLHGGGPYTIAVLHGGPGAPGSVFACAEALSKQTGVLEPMQTKHSVDALANELLAQISAYAEGPVTLIGHSWGAWLAPIAAAKYPHIANRIVLVGAGPLTDAYVPEIGKRRLANLSPEEGSELNALFAHMDEPSAFARIGALCDKADTYAPIEDVTPAGETDSAAYEAIWPEAAAMRTSGELLACFHRIQCPILVIHGDHDPHPPEGVLEPLLEAGIPHQAFVLQKCGHTPWKESFARDEFYGILNETQRMSEGDR